METRNNSGY